MLFLYLLKVSFLLAVVTLGYRWMVQFESYSRFNRVLLWLNVIAAWSLPLTPLPDWGPTSIQTEFHQGIPKIAHAAPAVKHKIAPYNPAPTLITRHRLNSLSQRIKALNPMKCLWVAYVSGVVLLLVHFLFQVGRLIWILLKSPKEKSGRNLIFVRHERVNSPYSFFRWIIINLENHSPEELRHIIAHESEHVMQWHSLDLMISEIQRILLWFNPFSWFHQNMVQANLEFLADRAVLENGFEKKQYQYSLLNTVLKNRELPLTTSFAQSLLKKRIKMMNRKPSHYLAWGKYILFIAVLYFSSAFVAPYKYQLIALTPKAIKPAIASLIQNNTEAIKSEASLNSDQAQIGTKAEMEIAANDRKRNVKGILLRNDTLYWAVSPLMTIEDFSSMRREINKFGGDLAINALQYDPMQKFIISISVYVKVKSGSGQSFTASENFEPIGSCSGFLLKDRLTIGAESFPAPLRQQIKADYEKAMDIYHQNEAEYFNYTLSKRIGQTSAMVFLRSSLEGKQGPVILEFSGVGKSSQNTFLITDIHKNSELYLDSKPITLVELSTLSFDKVVKVEVKKDRRDKKYVLVSTQ